MLGVPEFMRHFRKRASVSFEVGLLVRVGLPAADHHIYVFRFDLYDRRAPIRLFTGDLR